MSIQSALPDAHAESHRQISNVQRTHSELLGQILTKLDNQDKEAGWMKQALTLLLQKEGIDLPPSA